MASQDKINAVIDRTRQVYADCMLPSGCFVAAPSHMPYYPITAKNYLYSWPGRDAGFNLLAGLYLGLDYFQQHLEWLWYRAENFREAPMHHKSDEGLILRSYHPNGRIREGAFQADQNGTLLWAIGEYSKHHELTSFIEEVAIKAADGLVRHWAISYFAKEVEELWEERSTHPSFKTNFTYTLAATGKGLEWAGHHFSHSTYRETAEQMLAQIQEHAFSEKDGYFPRMFGPAVGLVNGVDASALGLAWPFNVIDVHDPRMQQTMKAIEDRLETPQGILRYEYDEYEGETEMGWLHFKQGAGSWPLLTFWMAIVKSIQGEKESANRYFHLVLDQVPDDNFIAEQLFPEHDFRVGVKPLLWSHSMFLHAAKHLGYL